MKAELVLLPAEYAASYCTGNSSNAAAKGSPYIDKTAAFPPSPPGGHHHMFGNGCIDHTMGFADVNEPLTKFLLEVLSDADSN